MGNFWSDISFGAIGPDIKNGQTWILDDGNYTCVVLSVDEKTVTMEYSNGYVTTDSKNKFRFIHTLMKE